MIRLVKLNLEEEVKRLLEALDELLEIKTFIRKIVPNYELDRDSLEEFKSLLARIHDNLKPLFVKYLDVSIEKSSERNIDKIKTQIIDIGENGDFILLSANSIKKKLKTMGVDPRLILVSGGPLVAEDYKLVNPNLHDKALKGIEKKCERIFNEIRVLDWKDKELYFLREKNNVAEDLIMKRISKLTQIIGKDVKIITLESWSDLD